MVSSCDPVLLNRPEGGDGGAGVLEPSSYERSKSRQGFSLARFLIDGGKRLLPAAAARWTQFRSTDDGRSLTTRASKDRVTRSRRSRAKEPRQHLCGR